MAGRSLDGAVVAVVGASGGLGREISSILHDRGARLVVAGRHRDRLDALSLDGAVPVVLDLRDVDAGTALATAARDAFGRLDGLVNAAGIVAFGPLTELDDVAIEELFLTNVVGPLWLLRRVLPLLVESKGFVVNLSAVVAEQPMASMVAYSATKAALTAADQALGRELRRAGVHVCDARPPHTETGLASRPIAGSAPRLPDGARPSAVAARIVQAIEQAEAELPAAAFQDH
jgi:short-subunit dehydrogenase